MSNIGLAEERLVWHVTEKKLHANIILPNRALAFLKSFGPRCLVLVHITDAGRALVRITDAGRLPHVWCILVFED